MKSDSVVIIGAGPAGLTAAYELAKLDRHVVVVEKQDRVGGLARTEDYRGFSFDLGGHRFFTKVDEVNRLWREILGDDLLTRPRLSRIYYNRKFFYYPLRPLNAVAGLGLWKSLLILLSYIRWQIFSHRQEETFEQWVTNRFGKRLFETFFKTYTEKVWGIPCSELRAEWAAQRIRGLSLKTALLNMFVTPATTIKTLIEQFQYPRLGPGMMWNAVKSQIERRQNEVRLNCEVIAICRNGNRIESVEVCHSGQPPERIAGSAFISTMPINDLLAKLDPPPPAEILESAQKLRYRDLIVVCLIVAKRELFPDNWIYVHDPGVSVGRVQNYKNWSPDMVPDPEKTSLGLEYFCSRGDDLWNQPDSELLQLGKREAAAIGLAGIDDIEGGCVVRVPYAYPVYDADYRTHLNVVRGFVGGFDNLQTIGRNGLHRYNNQDHAMMTGLLAARNLALGEKHDVWSVNTEPDYLEESVEDAAFEESLAQIFSKLDRLSFGLAVGSVCGALLFIATLWLTVKGGNDVGANLQLLRNYFPGYRVTAAGSIFGLAYGFASGF
ncbi:MAG TPA: NAD(P)/FAD-dependent oxidoreductase, partial [Candidatus Binatia bacterium]